VPPSPVSTVIAWPGPGHGETVKHGPAGVAMLGGGRPHQLRSAWRTLAGDAAASPSQRVSYRVQRGEMRGNHPQVCRQNPMVLPGEPCVGSMAVYCQRVMQDGAARGQNAEHAYLDKWELVQVHAGPPGRVRGCPAHGGPAGGGIEMPVGQ
jgi:hypothetical protein